MLNSDANSLTPVAPDPFPIKTEPGVYALMMALAKRQKLTVGKFGTHTLEPGYYMYAGSAHGAGGVRARTDRHRRPDKRLRWHVDYLRQVAPVLEVWFSHVDASREHDWVDTLIQMHGVQVPVPGFGARDCQAGCPAHLVRFDYRPDPAVFRHLLQRQHPDHEPVYTQYCVADDPITMFSRIVAEGDDDPLIASYFRGQVLLETVRRAGYDGRVTPRYAEDQAADPRTLRRIKNETASLLGISATALTPDIKLARAVDTLIDTDGERAFRACFLTSARQQAKSIERLSRTSVDRQRLRIGLVLDGDARSVGPQCHDEVFDTVDFGEVLSRLRRARGLIFCVRDAVMDELDRDSSRLCADIARVAALGAIRLRRLIDDRVSSQHVPPYLTRVRVKELFATVESNCSAVVRAKQALKFVLKNVWDYEEMRNRGIDADGEQTRALIETWFITRTVAQIICHCGSADQRGDANGKRVAS